LFIYLHKYKNQLFRLGWCHLTQVVTGFDLKSNATSRAGSNPAGDDFRRLPLDCHWIALFFGR
jgi:hypothetical protein